MAQASSQTTLVVYEFRLHSSITVELVLPRGILEELSANPADPRRDRLVQIVVDTVDTAPMNRRHAANPYVFNDLVWCLTMARITPQDRSVLDD